MAFIIVGIISNSFFTDALIFIIPPYLFCILTFISYFCESFQNTLEKYLMDIQFFDPFMLLASEGFFGMIFMGCILIIGNNIKCTYDIYGLCLGKGKPIDDFIEAMSFLFTHKDYLLLYSLIILARLGYNSMKMMMNMHFTPLHRNIAKDLRQFGVFFLELFDIFGIRKKRMILELGTYIITFIGDLIFLEVIILGFYGFNKNTKEEIIRREGEDNDINVSALLLNDSFGSQGNYDEI